jgi:hypothetical protein
LLESEFLTSFIALIASFLRKFKVLVDSKFSTARKIAGVAQGFILAPMLYSPFINDAPGAPGTHLALSAGYTCIYVTNTNVVFSANCNMASLLQICHVSTET